MTSRHISCSERVTRLQPESAFGGSVRGHPRSRWACPRRLRVAGRPVPSWAAAVLDHAPAGCADALNTFEHYVHHEDVRRAASSWVPRRLAPTDQGALWQQLSARAQWYLRSAPVTGCGS